jgi:large subunit ribosomal protein L4
MRSVLSEKARVGNIIGLDALMFAEAKTKNAVALLKALSLSGEKHVLIVVPEHSDTLRRATRNLVSQGLELRFAPNFSVRDALLANKIVIVQDAIAKIEAVWTSKSKQKTNNALGAQNETGEVSAATLTGSATEGAEVAA